MLAVLYIISDEIIARALKMAAFCLRLDLAIEVNRRFLKNEYSDVSFFFFCFELSNKFLYLRWPNTIFKCLCLIHHNFQTIYSLAPIFCKSQE